MNPPLHIHIPDTDLSPLLSTLSELIRHSRQKALRVVDTLQVQTCWNMGRHIIEHEQAGAARAEYGKQLLPTLAKALTAEFGKGFDERNLRHMRGFYQAFPIWNAVRTELSWTHYRTLLRVESEHARKWYMNETATLVLPTEEELRAELDREQALVEANAIGQ